MSRTVPHPPYKGSFTLSASSRGVGRGKWERKMGKKKGYLFL